MTWYERRELAIIMAVTLDGYGCVPRVGANERHIGRVQMFRKYGQRAGFYPVGSAQYASLSLAAPSWQKQQTMRLPK